MIKKNFALKFMSCVIIVATFFYYNKIMELRDEVVEANTNLEKITTSTPMSGSGTEYKDGIEKLE